MRTPIYIRRGNKADLPVLNAGEPGFAVDTKQLFIGAAGGNVGLWGDSMFSSRSAVLASNTGSQNLTLAVTNTWYKLPLGAESIDNLNEFDTTLSRFQPKKAGLYHVDMSFGVSNLAASQRVSMGLFKNGSLVYVLGQILYNGINSFGSLTGSVDIYLTPTDYIEQYANQSNGTGLTIDPNPIGHFMHITQTA